MRVRPSFVSVRPYLGAAFLATAIVVLLPASLPALLASALQPDPPPLVMATASVLLGLVLATVGAAWWSRRPQAKEIGFGELMIWGWWRRKRAEDRLIAGTRQLGLDPSGQPTSPVRVSRNQQVEVLKDLTAALESKDPYTHGHSRRVERHCYRTAAAMGLAIDDIEELRRAASLHDVGKVRVPDTILRKPGALTPDERLVLEEHSVVGAWMVSTVGSADVIAAVRHHHERWDGNGYPDGLSSYDIPLYARIISVADAYDALTSTRPYRAGCSREEAVAILRADSGTHFDPNVVDAFVASLPERTAVAGLIALLALPGGALRRIAVTAKNAGVANLAPAVGATGVAVLMGTTALAPSPATLPQQAPAEVSVQAPTGTDDAAAVPAPAERSDQRNAKEKQRPARDRREQARRFAVLGVTMAAPEHRGGASSNPNAPAVPSGGHEAGPATQPNGADNRPVPEQKPPDEPQPAAEENPPPPPEETPRNDEKPPEESRRSKPRSDPKPEKGRDCPREENEGEAKGHSYHCGD